MKIAIVGVGRLASTLAPALKQAGYSVTEIISRANPSSLRKARNLARNVGAHAASLDNANLDAKLIWFCVADGKIRDTARELATQPTGKTNKPSTPAARYPAMN